MRILLFICIISIFPSIALGSNDVNRRDYVYGTGNLSGGGSAHTYVDPQTGDIVTSVKPPESELYSNQPSYYNNQQNVPIYVYPQVTPSWPPTPGPHPGPTPSP